MTIFRAIAWWAGLWLLIASLLLAIFFLKTPDDYGLMGGTFLVGALLLGVVSELRPKRKAGR